MNKYLTICFTLFIISFSSLVHAIALEELQQQFNKYSVIRADFKQDRYIQGLTKPLHSAGKMIIAKELGLWWQQQTPFVMTLKMNEQRMEQSIAEQKSQIVTAEAQPQLFQFNYLLAAIFNADKTKLEKNFSLTLSEQGQQWLLTLKPQIAPLNRIFNQISLSGEKYLSQIIIDDKQNDKTIILFSHHKTTPLSQYEQQLFK